MDTPREINAGDAGPGSITLEAPRISFAMIARDEEPVIERCLRSVKGFVDEMIVVDTGSRDDTARIAESCGARVIHHRWGDDFSEARNVYLEAATGDWVLVLDADEELDVAAAEKIRRCARLRTLEGKDCLYFLQERSYLSDTVAGPTGRAVEHYIPRLIPRDPDVRYAGVIHENIYHRGGAERLAAIAVKDALIHHWGYAGEEQRRKNRTERNAPLLEKAVTLDPENPFTHYNFAVYLFDVKRYDEALEEFARSRQLVPEGFHPPWEPTASIFPALIALEREDIDEALILLQEALRIAPHMADAHYAMGRVLQRIGDEERALNHFQEALRTREGIPAYFGISDLGASTWKPCVETGSIFARRGEWKKALDFFTRARCFIPELTVIGTDMGLCHYNLGNMEEALALWDVSYPEGFRQAALVADYAQALVESGRSGDALAVLDRGLAAMPEEESLLLRKAQYLREMHEAKRAIEILSFHLKHTPSAAFFLERGLAHLDAGDRNAAMLDFSSAIEAQPDNHMAWNNLGAAYLAAGEVLKAAECFMRTLALKEDYPFALSNLARVYMIAADYSKAIPLLEKAVVTDRSDPRTLRFLLVESYLGAGRAADAEPVARSLAEEDPEGLETLGLLARVLGACGRHDDAWWAYEKLLRMRPEALGLYQEAGQILMAMGKYHEAVALIDRGLAAAGVEPGEEKDAPAQGGEPPAAGAPEKQGGAA